MSFVSNGRLANQKCTSVSQFLSVNTPDTPGQVEGLVGISGSSCKTNKTNMLSTGCSLIAAAFCKVAVHKDSYP